MAKQKQNHFREKFHLLNSQEHTEEINLISSGSSDYEDTSLLDKSASRVSKTGTLKRKRKKKVSKVSKNISNLSIKILDTSRELKKQSLQEKSPVLTCKLRRKSPSISPVLQSSRTLPKDTPASSPVITLENTQITSPILVLKTASPKSTVKVRKKLFKKQNDIENKSVCTEQNNICDDPIKKEEIEFDDVEIIASPVLQYEDMMPSQDSCGNSSKAKSELVKRVKSFFDRHFSQSSSLTSQPSISDISTPKDSSKTSDEIEILTCKSVSNNNSIKSLKEDSKQSSETSIYNYNKNTKKIRYKKDGLAYRLNNLLKKQNASLSLWQHERFLAANSNFVIPKGEFTVFRIQKAYFKYGCHLIESVDANDEKFLILINSCYVLDIFVCETVLKLYEPYNILDYSSDWKLVVNVTKFECSNY